VKGGKEGISRRGQVSRRITLGWIVLEKMSEYWGL